MNATCAAEGCANPVPRSRRGRPAMYCSPSCRPSRRNKGIVIEVLHPDESTDGRPVERTWTVRLSRGDRSVVVAHGLGWPSASALAGELDDLFATRPRRRKAAPID